MRIVNINDKERILKSAREKQFVTYKGTPIKLYTDFSAEILQTEESCLQNAGGVGGLPVKNTLPRKIVFQNRRRDSFSNKI